MFKNLPLAFLILFSSFITIYPSKKENSNLLDYCYSLEKIISRNLFEKSKNSSEKYKTFAKDITSFGTNKTQGLLVNKIIDQYKTSENTFSISFVPNQFYCLAGYWIESLKPGIFQSIIYEKSKQKIRQINNNKKELDAFIKDINLEYRSIKKEINDFF